MRERTPYILIVDDNELNRDLLLQRLRREGYELEVAEDGPSALKKISQRLPDLILLDIMMPGMSGYELITRLRADERTREVPVILVSARSETEDIVQGLELGANDYVTKPINLAVLRARIQTQLRLKRSLEEVRTLDRQKQELLSTVSHDLRSPLSGIAGLGRLLLTGELGPLTEPQQEALQDITRTAERLLELVNTLLDWSRLESGHLKLARNPVELRSILIETLQALRGAASDKRIELLLEASEEVPLLGDETRLFQVFSNLIGNAIKFSSPGGKVLVRLCRDREAACVEVLDEGPGIPESERDRIFERFYSRGHNGQKGLGLGLYICRAIVEQMGGRISVTNRPEGGACFRVCLPVSSPLPEYVRS